jgi:transposase-like protein
MEKYPMTALEFEDWFATEEACWEYLWELRWPEGVCCPRCGNKTGWQMGRDLWWCGNCNLQTSVTAGTIFHGTRKPLRVWFRAMWYITNQKHGVSALGLKRILKLGSYRTAWLWMHKLRAAMIRPGRERLNGIVEVDETYIGGKKKGKRGRGADGKTLVLASVQEDGNRIGRIRLRQVKDASARSLNKAVKEMIEPDSKVRTDGWNGYSGLREFGYKHQVVRKEASVGENLLPLVNRVVALLKRWLLGTHQGAIRPSHLDYYLDEFTFRFNRRTSRSRGKLFYRLIQQAAAVGPLSGVQIKGGSTKK